MAKRVSDYPRAQIKKFNERLRKLEKVYHTDAGISYAKAGKSEFYNFLYAQKSGLTSGESLFGEGTTRKSPFGDKGIGKFVTLEEDDKGNTKIRFINKTSWSKLSSSEQKQFYKLLDMAEHSKTMEKTWIVENYRKRKEKVLDRYPEMFDNLSPAEKEFKYEMYLEGVKNYWSNYEEHMGYDKEAWDLLSTEYDLTHFLYANFEEYGAQKAMNIFNKAMSYAAKGKINQIPKKYKINI